MSMRRAMLPVVMGLAIAACGSTPPIPDDHYYRLRSALEFAPGDAVLDAKLAVETPRAAGVRRSRAILFSEDPQHVRFKQYNYHHWDEAPGTMLHRRTLAAVRESGVAETVTSGSRIDAGYRLSSHLHRFDRLVRPDGVNVVVEVEFSLFDVKRPLDPVLIRTYEENLTADSTSMEDTVLAFSEATDRVIKSLIEDLRAL